jgi:hypothetical protein
VVEAEVPPAAEESASVFFDLEVDFFVVEESAVASSVAAFFFLALVVLSLLWSVD